VIARRVASARNGNVSASGTSSATSAPAAPAGPRGDILQQRRQIDRLCLLGPLAARERQISADHAFHLGDIGLHLGDILAQVIARRQHRQCQPQPRQRRAQIVRHAGQHLGPLHQKAADPFLHPIERGRRAAHLQRALGLSCRRRDPGRGGQRHEAPSRGCPDQAPVRRQLGEDV